MEDLPVNVLAVIASVIIAAGLLTFGYMYYQEGNKATNIVTQNAITQKNNIKDQKFMDYDGTEFQGSGVLRTIKLFQNEEITIQVDHISHTDEFLYTLDTDGNLGSRKEDINADYDAAKYQFSDSSSTVEYINPNDNYKATLIYSPVGAIIGIKFTYDRV